MSSEEMIGRVESPVLEKLGYMANIRTKNTPEGLEKLITAMRVFEEKTNKKVQEYEEKEEIREQTANNRGIFTDPKGKAYDAVQKQIKKASEKNTKTTEEYEYAR